MFGSFLVLVSPLFNLIQEVLSFAFTLNLANSLFFHLIDLFSFNSSRFSSWNSLAYSELLSLFIFTYLTSPLALVRSDDSESDHSEIIKTNHGSWQVLFKWQIDWSYLDINIYVYNTFFILVQFNFHVIAKLCYFVILN
jgi:hypothetical protein